MILMCNELPILVGCEKNCCGCTACYSICPIDAIEMIENNEGFLYPKIDKNRCIRCHQCERVCVFKTDQRSRDIYG